MDISFVYDWGIVVTRLEIRRKSFEISRADLAVLSDVSEWTIKQIESEHKLYKTNVTIAEALADALDCKVNELFDSIELSNIGRTAHTGKPIGSQRRSPDTFECPRCHQILSKYITCEEDGVSALDLATT